MSKNRFSALPPVPRGNPALDRWIDAVNERLEVLAGARGSESDRAATLADLRQLGLTDLSQRFARLPAPKTTEQFAQEIKGTQLYADLLSRIGTGGYDGVPDAVKTILRTSLTEEAAKRGASISTTETKLRSAIEDVAYRVTQVTSSFEQSFAGVREVTYAATNYTQATAGKVTTIQARIDGVAIDPALILPTVYATLAGATGTALQFAVPVGVVGKYYQVAPATVTVPVTPNTLYRWTGAAYVVAGSGTQATIEQSMQATADRVKGVAAEYAVKINAGGAVAGFGLSASEDPSGATQSAFIIAADQFAVVPTYTFNQTATPSATAVNQTWLHLDTRVTKIATATGTLSWAAYTQDPPFGVDTTTGTVYINGGLLVTGSVKAGSLDATAIDGKVITGATVKYGKTSFAGEENGFWLDGFGNFSVGGAVNGMSFDANSGVIALNGPVVGAGNILPGAISTSQFGDDHLIINPSGLDIDVELRFNRTTGGSASLTWNGDLVQCSKSFKPAQLGINNISATAPSSPFAGQVWIQP